MLFEDGVFHCGDGVFQRSDLIEYVDAVSTLLDHVLNAADLAFDAFERFDLIFVAGIGWMGHSLDIQRDEIGENRGEDEQRR